MAGTLLIDPRQELFEFSPLLLNKTHILRPDTDYGYDRLDSRNVSTIGSAEYDDLQESLGPTKPVKQLDYMNANKTFNRKTLQ